MVAPASHPWPSQPPHSPLWRPSAGNLRQRPRPSWRSAGARASLLPRPALGLGARLQGLGDGALARLSGLGAKLGLLRDQEDRPRLCKFVEAGLCLLLRLLLAAEAGGLSARIVAKSNRSLIFGRLGSLRVQMGRVRRGLALQKASVECGALDLGIKPLLVLLLPFMMFIRPSFFLPVLLLVLFLPGLPPAVRQLGGQTMQVGRPRRMNFSAELAADDLAKSKLWRFLLTVTLRDIMEYSVAGQVTLPRELSGEISNATSFELENVSIADCRFVMDAVARLPDGTLFKYVLRTGVALQSFDGEDCLFWQDPEIRVSPGWNLPDFWAPIGGFAGRRFGETLQFTRLELLPSGRLVVEGSVGGGPLGVKRGAIVPAGRP